MCPTSMCEIFFALKELAETHYPGKVRADLTTKWFIVAVVNYTPNIYADGYIAFVFPFVCSSVCLCFTFCHVGGIYVKVFC